MPRRNSKWFAKPLVPDRVGWTPADIELILASGTGGKHEEYSRAKASLSEADRETLACFEGCLHKRGYTVRAAEHLGITPAAARKRLERVRWRLYQAFNRELAFIRFLERTTPPPAEEPDPLAHWADIDWQPKWPFGED